MGSKELCSICYAMSARPIVNEDPSGALDKPWKSNHHTIGGLEKSVDMGCPLCSIFWDGLCRKKTVDEFLGNRATEGLR
jgi:hypothetical protein